MGQTYKSTVLIILLFFLSSCGQEPLAGFQSLVQTPTRALAAGKIIERPLYYGYIQSCTGCFAQTSDHVNIIWQGDWTERTNWTLEDEIQDLKTAQLPAILEIHNNETLEITLKAFHEADVLKYIVALYPIDEPDLQGYTDLQVKRVIDSQRKIASAYPELKDVKFAVIYGASRSRPGLAYYDWLGFDDYPNGVNAVGKQLDDFERLLAPHQKVILVPGGASPWETPPEAFLERARTDEKVLLVLPFVWFTWGAHKGISENGMADAYRNVGKALIKNGSPRT